MFSALNFIRKNVAYFVVLVIIIGLLNVYFFGGFSVPKIALVLIVIVLVVFPVMINTNFGEVIKHIKEPRPVFCSLLINFIISPFIAYGLSKLFLAEQPELFAALMLISLIPTSAMSAVWTAFAGARMETALYLIPANLLISAFIALPFVLPLFIGDAIEINRFLILEKILLVFVLPLIVGDIVRRIIIKFKGRDYFKDRIKPELGGVSAFGLLILLFLVMSSKRNAILFSDLSLIYKIIVPVISYYFLMYVLSWLWAKLLVWRRILPPEKAIVIIFTSVTRHVNITLAIILSAFAVAESQLMVLVAVVAFLVQIPSMAFYATHFGKKFVGASVDEA